MDKGILKLGHRVCVVGCRTQKENLTEAYSTPYTAHLGVTNVQDLRSTFWCEEMKKDIADFV